MKRSLLILIGTFFIFVSLVNFVHAEDYEDGCNDVQSVIITGWEPKIVDNPSIDITECLVGNNNTILFLKLVMQGDIKNEGGRYISYFYVDNYKWYGRLEEAVYENGNATFSNIPILYSIDKNTVLFEVSLESLSEKGCIHDNSVIIRVMTREEKPTEECYVDDSTKFTYTLTEDTLSTQGIKHFVSHKDSKKDVKLTRRSGYTDKRSYLDIKKVSIENNNTILFIKMEVFDKIKNAEDIGYICWFNSHNYNKTNGNIVLHYENGNAEIAGKKMIVNHTDSMLSFEISIPYLEELGGIWNGSELEIVPWCYHEIGCDEWYQDSAGRITYNLTDYREQEDYPKAYIDYVTPNPAMEGDTVYFSGHGATSENTSILEYEWVVNNELMSNQSSFTLENISRGAYISFRVKDSNGKWSKQVMERLDVKSDPDISPSVEILIPSDSQKVRGKVEIIGRAECGAKWFKNSSHWLKRIDIDLPSGYWSDHNMWTSQLGKPEPFLFLNQTNVTFYYIWNSTDVPDGPHMIYLSAWDGEHSSRNSICAYVSNEEGGFNWEEMLAWPNVLYIIGIILFFVMVGIVLVWALKKGEKTFERKKKAGIIFGCMLGIILLLAGLWALHVFLVLSEVFVSLPSVPLQMYIWILYASFLVGTGILSMVGVFLFKYEKFTATFVLYIVLGIITFPIGILGIIAGLFAWMCRDIKKKEHLIPSVPPPSS